MFETVRLRLRKNKEGKVLTTTSNISFLYWVVTFVSLLFENHYKITVSYRAYFSNIIVKIVGVVGNKSIEYNSVTLK